MKKAIVYLFLLLPTLLWAQEIIGKWHQKTAPAAEKVVIEYKTDGTIDLYDYKNPENKVLKNSRLTYTLSSEEGINYIETTIHRGNQVMEVRKMKYKIEKNKLYLPRLRETNGIESTIDYQDEYIRLE